MTSNGPDARQDSLRFRARQLGVSEGFRLRDRSRVTEPEGSPVITPISGRSKIDAGPPKLRVYVSIEENRPVFVQAAMGRGHSQSCPEGEVAHATRFRFGHDHHALRSQRGWAATTGNTYEGV